MTMTDNTIHVQVEGWTYRCRIFREPVIGWAVQTVVDAADGSISVERIKPLELDDADTEYAFPLYRGGKANRVTILPGAGAVHVFAEVIDTDVHLTAEEAAQRIGEVDLGIETPEARTNIPEALRRAIYARLRERERKIKREIKQAERKASQEQKG
jgi:hypothetical protein